MVQSVAAVSGVGKIRREPRDSFYSGTKEKESIENFAQIFEEAKQETRNTSIGCHTTTYGRDCKIRTFLYQPGKYRY